MIRQRMSVEEAGRLGMEWYNGSIRSIVETEENIGKLLLIDVETGEYEIGTDQNSMEMTDQVLAKKPHAELVQLRIGYLAVHSFGGFRLMPSKP